MATQPQNWDKVKALFHKAMELDSSARSAFLRDKCPDAEVRAEVERLLAEHDQAGGFLSTPALEDFPVEVETPTQRLLEGELLAGRFRIVRFIASGGMGEVYEAEDQELRERVAVKIIRPEILAQPNAITRFRREVHLARKVTHPNVCRIFDLSHHKPTSGNVQEEIVFISMELLHGKTLEQQLKAEGPFNVSEALPLVQQMASALAAAHEVGIVHRDFKPGNVVLAGGSATKWRAVVTDFGLAHRPPTSEKSASLSTGQGLLGTPAYMSPEQLEGRPAEPSSDIYALGLVIYEMVTGAKPFQGDTPLSAALKRLTETPIPPQKFKPGLSQAWESVILRCLERDPAQRFACAEDVAEALAGGEPGLSLVFQQKALTEKLRYQQYLQLMRRKPAARLLIAAALCFIALGAIVIRIEIPRVRKLTARISGVSNSGPPTGQIHVRPAVAVLGFRNLSKLSDKSWLSESLSEALNSELSQGGQVRIVSGELVSRAKSDLSLPDSESYAAGTLHRIRDYVSADYVVLGSFLDLEEKNHAQIRVDARLQDTRSGETIDSVIETGEESNLNDLFARTGADLRKSLNLAPSTPHEQMQTRASRPTNLEAARYYAEGLEKLRAFDYLEARESFEKAISIEPTFAMAHSALATAWANLGYDEKALSSAKRALELAGSLSSEDHLWIEAQFHEASHEPAKAVESFQALFSTYPDNIEYGLRLLNAQLSSGENKEAQATLESLRKLPSPASNDPRIDLAGANVAYRFGDHAQSRLAASRAAQKAESEGARLTEALALMREGAVLHYLGQDHEATVLDEKARHIFAEAGDRDYVARVNSNLATILMDHGEYNEAARRYQDSLEEFRRIGDKRAEGKTLSDLGWAALNRGKLDESQAYYEEALRIHQETGDMPMYAVTLSNFAEVMRRKGNLDAAIRKNEEVLAMARERGNLGEQALNDLAYLFIMRGNLSTSKNLVGQAMAKTQQIRAKAVGLRVLGDVLTAEDDLVSARRRYNESANLEESDTSGNKSEDLPECQMSLATLDIEERRTADAQTLLKQVIEEFRAQGNEAGEARALSIYARSELESGRITAALEKAEAAKRLAVRSDFLQRDLGTRLILARLQGLTGNRQAAAMELKEVLTEANRQGNVPVEFDVRFAQGEIALKAQDPAGRKILSDLSNDAASKGFLLVSRKARSELGR